MTRPAIQRSETTPPPVSQRLIAWTLRLTTRRCPVRWLVRAELGPAVDAGWQVRLAGARWDTVWARERALQRHLRVLVLPDAAGLTDRQWAALAMARQRDLGLSTTVPQHLLADLVAAQGALWMARQRES